MCDLVSSPYFQIGVGAVVSFAGSVVANYLFYGKVAKKRAARESQRAYNKLMNRLVRTTITDISDPLHIMPTDIADRIEDLRYTLRDVNDKFELNTLVGQAIQQAANLRKNQQEQHGNKS
jgi:hypothetical protein